MAADETAEAIVLGSLALDLGRVERSSLHQDGVRPESDTDHTVMLGWVACSFAAAHPEMGLDIGSVAQFALAHDAVEALAGDVCTLRITPEGREEKRRRERIALEDIRSALPLLRWMPVMIERYEQLDSPEARYVKAMDKLVPKITHVLDQGVALRELGMTQGELTAWFARQRKELACYASDFPPLFELHGELVAWALETLAQAV